MTELAALNVKINGDATGLRSALNAAESGLERVGAQATQTQAQVAATSGGMSRLGQVFQRNSFAISNAANQFSDLAVQMSMGVPASRALSQQLPQMTAFMGPLVSILGVASGVLIGLAGNFLMASENARTYQNAIDDLEALTSRIGAANDILSMSLYDLSAQYGTAAERVRELALAEIELAIARQRGAVAQAMQNEELQNALSEYGGLTRVVGMMGEIFYDTSDAVRAIERDLHVTGQTAADLAVAFQQLRNASTMEETLAAWEQINGLLSEAGISLSDLPPSLAQALSGVINLEQAMIDYTAAVSKAAQETQALAAAMPMTTGGVGPSAIGPDGQIRMPPAAPGEAPVTGGGGGGGASLADRIERDLERLREGFMSEEELQIAAYERQQELLEEALNKRLLTQQEFAELMQQAQRQHQERMAEIDVYRYGTGLQQAQQFFGDMASALQGGNEEMARISRVFAAGEALVNAWRAYTQTIADPTLPFFAKIPAALSVLSAGMRAVSAINSGGTSAAAASGGGASAGAAAAAASVGPQIMLNVQPNARGDIPMATFRGVIDDINRSLDRGGRIIAA